MSKTQHTPTPWTWSAVGEDRTILDANRDPVLAVDKRADLRDMDLRSRIVSCVNAHDDLVAALKWIVANCDGPAFGKAQAALKKCGEID